MGSSCWVSIRLKIGVNIEFILLMGYGLRVRSCSQIVAAAHLCSQNQTDMFTLKK